MTFLKNDCESEEFSFKDVVREAFCKARYLVSWGTAGDKNGSVINALL